MALELTAVAFDVLEPAAVGAFWVADRGDRVRLTEPDGNEFHLRAV